MQNNLFKSYTSGLLSYFHCLKFYSCGYHAENIFELWSVCRIPLHYHYAQAVKYHAGHNEMSLPLSYCNFEGYEWPKFDVTVSARRLQR